VSKTTQEVNEPKLVEGFDGNVADFVMGPTHSALITTDGELYTFGSGKNGALGHNNGQVSEV
jgi:alpha-tubulin suppressor-like RCC1 family protein